MVEQSKILIIARPGRVRDGLRALVSAIPRVDAVDRSCSGMFSTNLITEHNPDMVLVNCNSMSVETLDALRQLRMQAPGLSFLILVEDVKQQHLVQDAGFDHVLLKGISVEKLTRIIRELLTHRSKG